jgi:hypothetical protein
LQAPPPPVAAQTIGSLSVPHIQPDEQVPLAEAMQAAVASAGVCVPSAVQSDHV